MSELVGGEAGNEVSSKLRRSSAAVGVGVTTENIQKLAPIRADKNHQMFMPLEEVKSTEKGINWTVDKNGSGHLDYPWQQISAHVGDCLPFLLAFFHNTKANKTGLLSVDNRHRISKLLSQRCVQGVHTTIRLFHSKSIFRWVEEDAQILTNYTNLNFSVLLMNLGF